MYTCISAPNPICHSMKKAIPVTRLPHNFSRAQFKVSSSFPHFQRCFPPKIFPSIGMGVTIFFVCRAVVRQMRPVAFVARAFWVRAIAAT